MGLRRKALTRLHKELETIAVFDRVHEYATDSNLAANDAHRLRQVRRSQIMAEIEKLSAPGLPFKNHARISGAIVFLFTVGYATVHYLLK